jgi:urea transport system permease protein
MNIATSPKTPPAPDLAQVLDPAVRKFRVVLLSLIAVFFVVVIPVLNMTGVVADLEINRMGRYLAMAIAAIGIDLIWGYTGILSLCQALFFCLGGYCMAMFLSLPQGGGDVRPEYHNIPQFFFFNNVDSLPFHWVPFQSPIFALGMAIVLPAVVSSFLGFFIFRSRVRGVYFSIITQAVAWGGFLALCRNEMLLGGTNGLTNFYKPLNQSRPWIIGLYLGSLAVLVIIYLLCRYIVNSRLGRVLVAVRDGESRLRFAGYQPELYKVFAYALAAVIAAIGGMMYAPQNGIITPNIMRVEDSIWMVVWVALGGRGRLWGGIVGSLIILYSQSILTSAMPAAWPFVQGAMFLTVVLFFPDGFVGLWDGVEEQIVARAGFRKIALTMAPLMIVIFFILSEALGLTPDALAKPILTVPLKFILLLAVLGVVVVIGRVPKFNARPISVPAAPLGHEGAKA